MALQSKPGRLYKVFGAFGFGITAILFGYIELTNYSPMNAALIWASNVLCPAWLLSYFLFDLNAHSVEMTFAWTLIGLFNAGIYAVVGALIERFLRNPLRRPTS